MLHAGSGHGGREAGLDQGAVQVQEQVHPVLRDRLQLVPHQVQRHGRRAALLREAAGQVAHVQLHRERGHRQDIHHDTMSVLHFFHY